MQATRELDLDENGAEARAAICGSLADDAADLARTGHADVAARFKVVYAVRNGAREDANGVLDYEGVRAASLADKAEALQARHDAVHVVRRVLDCAVELIAHGRREAAHLHAADWQASRTREWSVGPKRSELVQRRRGVNAAAFTSEPLTPDKGIAVELCRQLT